MTWRFRRSKSLGKGVRLTVSKRGIGISTGIKGARVGIGPKGPYTSLGLPGTGLYRIDYSGKGGQRSKSVPVQLPTCIPSSSTTGCFGCFGSIIILFGLLLLFSYPIAGLVVLTFSTVGIISFFKSPQQRAQRKVDAAQNSMRQSDFEQAIILLQEAEETDPENKQVKRFLGICLAKAHKFQQAIPFLKDEIVRNPDDSYVSLLLGGALLQMKHYEEAIPFLQKIDREDPLFLKAILILGGCFAVQKKYELAIESLKKAPLRVRDLDADLMAIHYLLGQVYEETGERENALRHLRKVYAEDANYEDVGGLIERIEGGKGYVSLREKDSLQEKQDTGSPHLEPYESGDEEEPRQELVQKTTKPDKQEDKEMAKFREKNACPHCSRRLSDENLMSGICPYCKKIF